MFYPRMNKPNTDNNITGISSFQNRLNDLLAQLIFYFKSKVVEGYHKGKSAF